MIICCRKCNINKDDDLFNNTEKKTGHLWCKACIAEYNKNYRSINELKIKQQKKEYYYNNIDLVKSQKREYYKNNRERCLNNSKKRDKSIIKLYKKQYRFKNKNKLNQKDKLHYINNRDKYLNNQKKYYQNNADKIKKYQKDYSAKNKHKIKTYSKKYNGKNKHKLYKNKISEKSKLYLKQKYKNDLLYKLRVCVSRSVGIFLKVNGSSKNNESVIKYLPYTIHELKNHIESLFEPWMNWNNRGVYNIRKWDDNDQSTWVWHLDHIIPHSKFKYKTMDSEEFMACWNLNNLRPYSAKQNVLDGNRR